LINPGVSLQLTEANKTSSTGKNTVQLYHNNRLERFFATVILEQPDIIPAMEYDIIATLGPRSADAAIWREMLNAGITGFRLNISHLTEDQVYGWIESILGFYNSTGLRIPLVLDLQGSKWRLGQFKSRVLEEGQVIHLVHAASTQLPHELPVPHADFFRSASTASGDIYLNDAKVCLMELVVEQESIRAKVVRGGAVSAGKGITYPASGSRKEALTDKDHRLVEQTHSIDFIRYAVSYVRDAVEMARYRAIIGDTQFLIAKLERKPALEQVVEIAKLSEEIWLCRGDLGAELGDKAMAEAVHHFSAQVRSLPVPVILAGQVLEHMTTHAAPTRSEVCYLYNALEIGYRGFVLSDETSIGQYPLSSCQTAALFRPSPAELRNS
jgi:pyruvate kinase